MSLGLWNQPWIQHKTPVLTFNVMACSNMPVTEIGPSLAKLNTMSPLNTWSDEMRVHVVLMGGWNSKTSFWQNSAYLLLLILMLWYRQAIFESKGNKLLALLNTGFEPRGSLEPNLQQTECPLTDRLSYQGSSTLISRVFYRYLKMGHFRPLKNRFIKQIS